MKEIKDKLWLPIILGGYSRHIVKLLMPMIIATALYTSLVVFLFTKYYDYYLEGTLAIHTMLGVVLGLFLVLRTNTAYDRWWEGRKLWGQLVNDSRSFILKISAYLPESEKESRIFFKQMIPNQAYAMKRHLRNIPEDLLHMNFISQEDRNTVANAKHKPNIINQLMHKRVMGLFKSGKISGEQLINLDKELKGFSDIIGACERIKKTPIPYSYSMFIKKFIFFYIITIPFGFVHQFHYLTIPIVLIVFYFIVSIELIAEEIEDPFGSDINDLPLDAICHTIEGNVQELIPDA